MHISSFTFHLLADECPANCPWADSHHAPRCPHSLLILVPLIILLSACSAPIVGSAPIESDPQTLVPRIVPIEVPVTVEVTREVIRETVVPATPQPPEPCAPTNLAEAEEVVVGVLLPISQPSSLASSVSIQAAIVLANANLDAAGGVHHTPVKLWWGDTGNMPEQGRQRALEAILQHCAVALIGANNSATSVEVDVIAQQYGVPHVIIDGAQDSLTASQSPTLFRITPNNSMNAQMYSGWAAAVGDYNDDGVVTATIIGDASTTLRAAQIDTIRDGLEEAGIATDLYMVEAGASDYSSLVARIVVKDTLPDMLFVRIGGDSGSLLLRQLIENGVNSSRNTLLVATRMPHESDPFWSILGDRSLGLVGLRMGIWPAIAGPEAQPLVDGFSRLFDRWPDGMALSAHDALLLLVDAMQRAPSLASRDMIWALETSNIKLANGVYTFPVNSLHAGDEGTPPWAWHQWMDLPLIFLQRTPVDAEIIWPPSFATIDGAYVPMQ